MKLRWKHAAVLSLLALTPWSSQAQMEVISPALYQESLKKLSGIATKNPYLQKFLKTIGKDTAEQELVTAVRVAEDTKDSTGKVLFYSVPAMSDLQRLPDVYPLDGTPMAPVRIIMAQDEYEPGSFLLYPLENLGKVELKLTEFRTADGKILPADKLDLKVIKIWYQNKNGWYSYFGDTELKLVPELLLNDEDLIKVDTEKVQNYARLTEKKGNVSHVSYEWISAPLEIDKRKYYPFWRTAEPFQSMKENFMDADKLQPVTLEQGKFKQFFLTVHAEKNQAPGLYKGAVNLVKNGAQIGSVPVAVRVLPFALPQPHTYADTNKPFLVSSYSYISFDQFLSRNGGSYDLMDKQFLAVFENQVKHNQTMHMLRGNAKQYEHAYTIDMLKRSGMRTDYLMGGGPTNMSSVMDMKHDAKMLRDYYTKQVGHTNIFFGYGDEPPVGWVRNQINLFKIYKNEGLKFFIAGGDQVFYGAGYLYDFYNTAHWPESRDVTRKWNDIGKTFLAWYAQQHIGAENPAYNRRQNGIAPYLANFSALCNYAHHFGPYNDRCNTYKPMVYAYGSGNGVIDTIQWEGFREGVDDIRYATALKRLAQEAADSKNMDIQNAGRAALQYFAELDPETGDMNEMRLEMIQRILSLRKMLGK